MMTELIEHIRYKKITENSEYFFYINSESIDEDIDFINGNKVVNIGLSEYDAYDLLDASPIRGINFIQNLTIFVRNIDLKDLNGMRGLEKLSIGETYKNLDLNGLPALRSLYLTKGSFVGLQSLNKLKELTIVHGDTTTFSSNNFYENSPIESLSILNAKGNVDFSFFSKLRNLKKLNLYNVKAKVDARLFESFSGSLESLEVERCKGLQNLEAVLPGFDALKYLKLINSPKLSSTGFLSNLKSLEIGVFLGSSYFIDGNIDVLRRLKHASIDDKKHYSLKDNQLPKIPYE